MHTSQYSLLLATIFLTTLKVSYKPTYSNFLAGRTKYATFFLDQSEECSEIAIQLENNSVQTFEDIFNFIYSGEIALSVDNLEAILDANKTYKIQTLKDACQEAMLNVLSVSTCLKLNSLAGQNTHTKLFITIFVNICSKVLF